MASPFRKPTAGYSASAPITLFLAKHILPFRSKVNSQTIALFVQISLFETDNHLIQFRRQLCTQPSCYIVAQSPNP